jgi:amidase
VNPIEVCFLSATELARLLRRKQISAREVLDAHLLQIERTNPQVNAVITLVEEQARARAREADQAAAHGNFFGPLHGLPAAHKDLHETAGIRTTFGSPIFKDYVPNFSALIVERMQAAGAITIGKTNTPEFGAGSQTFNPVFGATRNPWDLSKTCGGSSGGAAAALCCGMVPIADGSDVGGSLRNPASFCSVVGFRTSPGRVPNVPSRSAWNTLNVAGAMARTVEDVALMLSAIAGPDPRAPLSIHEPGSRFAQDLGRDFRGVRIGWVTHIDGVPFGRRVLETVNAQRRAFESLGAITEDAEPDFSGADESFKTLRALNFYLQIGAALGPHRSLMKQTVIDEIERGSRLTGPQIAEAELQRSRLFARMAVLMERYEFLVLPTVQVPPFDIEQPYVTGIEGIPMESYIDWMRSCYYISLTALPAISVPAGFTRDSLPVGLQIVGRHQDDWGVLQLAHAFEHASGLSRCAPPWCQRTPSTATGLRP